MGVPAVLTLLPVRVLGCFHWFLCIPLFFYVFLWDVVVPAACQWGVHAGPAVSGCFCI